MVEPFTAAFGQKAYFCLNVFPIELPPLRERREDIPLLLNYFLAKKGRELGKPQIQLDPQAQELFTHYDWPGNIRELENIVTRLIILTADGRITREMVSANLQQGQMEKTEYFPKDRLTWEELNRVKKEAAAMAMEKVEREFLDKLLKKYANNVTEAARALGLNKSTLYRLVQKYRDKVG